MSERGVIWGLSREFLLYPTVLNKCSGIIRNSSEPKARARQSERLHLLLVRLNTRSRYLQATALTLTIDLLWPPNIKTISLVLTLRTH